MVPLDYQAVCDELVAMGHIEQDMVWPLQAAEDSLELAYTHGLFRYAQDALVKTYPHFEIHPARFCYVNDDNIDAQATYYDKYYSILLNIGAIRSLRGYFDHELERHSEFQLISEVLGSSEVSSPTALYLLTISSIFLFEHERAHLSQFSRQLKRDSAKHLKRHIISYRFKKSCYKRKEASGKRGKFDIYDHLLEMDADLNGISYAGSFLLQLLTQQYQQIPQEHFHELYAAGIAAVLVLFYYWFRTSNAMPLYFRKNDHPHPIIRTFYSWDYFLALLRDNQTMFNFPLDFDRIKKRAMELQDKIVELNGHGQYDINLVHKYGKRINKYVDTLADGLQTEPVTLQYAYRKAANHDRRS